MSRAHQPGEAVDAVEAAPRLGGLQAERTALAWNRTALGLAANAAVLSTRELQSTAPAAATVPIVLAVLIALATVGYGRHRDTQLRRDPLPRLLAPRRALITLGIAVTTLAIASGAVILV